MEKDFHIPPPMASPCTLGPTGSRQLIPSSSLLPWEATSPLLLYQQTRLELPRPELMGPNPPPPIVPPRLRDCVEAVDHVPGTNAVRLTIARRHEWWLRTDEFKNLQPQLQLPPRISSSYGYPQTTTTDSSHDGKINGPQIQQIPAVESNLTKTQQMMAGMCSLPSSCMYDSRLTHAPAAAAAVAVKDARNVVPPGQYRRSCEGCRASKVRCDGKLPCTR